MSGFQGRRGFNPAVIGAGHQLVATSFLDVERRLIGFLRWSRPEVNREGILHEVEILLFGARKAKHEGRGKLANALATQVLHEVAREGLPAIKAELERLKLEAGLARVEIPREIVAAIRASEKAEQKNDFASAAGKLSYAVMTLREDVKKIRVTKHVFRDPTGSRRA